MRNSPKIVRRDSPLSFLQQRLNYADRLGKPLTYLVENVPAWPEEVVHELPNPHHAWRSYENCQGSRRLLEAVCKREHRHYGLELRPENILVSNGAFHGISLITQSLYRNGTRILCQGPVLESVEKILRMQGYGIEYFRPEAEVAWAHTIGEICRRDLSIRLLYLNLPHNPSGSVISDQDMAELVELAAQLDIYLLVDLVYDSYVFSGGRRASPLSFTDNWQDLYVVNSMSKNYGAPGLRIGWIVSDPANIGALTSRLEAECISVCSAAQEQAAALLERGNAELVQRVQGNWAFVGEQLARLDGARFIAPAGGTQYFPALPVDDVEAFADFMLAEHGVVLVTSGNYVGVEEACIRVPLGYPRNTLSAAVDKLIQGLESWSELKSSARASIGENMMALNAR